MCGAAAAGGGWIVAATIGGVEALKDDGVCRWNFVLRSAHHRAKDKLQTVLPNGNGSSDSIVGDRAMRDVDRLNKTENSIKKVMDISCWGPSTVRF